MSKKSDDRKNIVIIGGGFFGTLLARKFSASRDAAGFNLILIDALPYTVHRIATARIVVADENNITDLALLPRDKLLLNGNGTITVGTVTAIEEIAPGKGGEVVLASGEKVPYAALVLATGSHWHGPIDFPLSSSDDVVRAHIGDWRKRFANANHVVLVGGGAVGVELAGELRDVYPKKKITIVHAGDKLLNSTYPDKFRLPLEKRCRDHGFDLVLGDYVDEFPEEGTVGLKTRKGKVIEDADLVVPTFGPRPNTEVIVGLGSDVLSSTGHVKVKPTLELQSHPGVFALGDIIDWLEQHQAAKAAGQIDVVLPNVISFLNGTPQKKVYKGAFEMIGVTIGRNGGYAYFGLLWGITLGDWFVRFLKGKDLLVGMARKDRGL